MTTHRPTPRDLRGPADQQTMRDHNLALVLQHVSDVAESSRARIAADTGLNKTTVSSLVAELIDHRLLCENGIRHDGAAGRPAVNVRIDDSRYVGVGMEINVDYMAYVIVDLRGRVRDERMVINNYRLQTAEQTLVTMGELVAESLARLWAEGFVLAGANLALPGLVDADRRRLLIAPNLGWHDVDAAEVLAAHLDPRGAGIFVDNEANMAALGERWEGSGRDLADFIHVSGEIGVGAGVIISGRLHRGATGFGGEFGHMTLVPDGGPCACGGRGCVETYVGLEPTLRLAGIDVDQALLTAVGTTMTNGPANHLARLAQQGDERVLAALDHVGGKLGTALASAVNMLGPESVILGGYFAPLHPWLHRAITREFDTRVLGHGHRPTSVRQSDLQRGAAIRGAAGSVVRSLLANPSRVTTLEAGVS